MRILAVQMNDDVFLALKEHIKNQGMTTKEYITKMALRDMGAPQQTQTQERPAEAMEQESTESMAVQETEPEQTEQPAVSESNSEQPAEELPAESQPRIWEKDSVAAAIEQFINENGRTPTQKEFRNENGLPSYKAAAKILERSPAEYSQQRYEELSQEQAIAEPEYEPVMGM